MQYFCIAAACDEYSRRSYHSNHPGYSSSPGYSNSIAPRFYELMYWALPTVVLAFYLVANQIVGWLDKKRPRWKILLVGVLFLVQYLCIAAACDEYAHRSYYNNHPGYSSYPGPRLHELMYWALPTVFLLIYIFVHRLTAWADHNRMAVAEEAESSGTNPSQPASNAQSAPKPQVVAAAAVPQQPPHVGRWRQRYEKPLPALVLGTPRQRVTELLGSLLLCAPVAAAVTVIIFLTSSSYQDQPLRIEQLAWIFLVGLAGAWSVLIPAKFWEGASGDQTLRRFVMMLIGMGLGLAACGWAQFLLISDLPHNAHLSFLHPDWAPRWFYDREVGRPLWPAYVTAFGTLFLLIRWWQQADPLRTVRLSLGALIATVILAFIAADVWGFPQPWLPRIAAVISASVLLSSRWIGPHQRTHPRL